MPLLYVDGSQEDPTAQAFYMNIAIYHTHTRWYDWDTYVSKHATDWLSFAYLASILLNT